ncbi:hypothetical protein Fmac_009338 [Flemingia macrophylla]|uniref:Uncharacterized protein n=1 Tax=Flemingia macrophylla TaxID=520843 RepID=A0ABD1MZY2_9FABA
MVFFITLIQVTFMKLKVDLECVKCYKKVKKLLVKYPQIRDQIFNEKENIVMITVVCCSPEKIRDKLCYKGGGSIKSIEILEPKPEKKKDAADKPKVEPEKKKDGDKPKGGDAPKADKPKADAPKADKPKSEAPKADKPKAEPEKKKDGGEKPEKKKDGEKEAPKKDAEKPKAGPGPVKPVSAPLPVQPHMAAPMAVPVGMLYAPAPCYEGRPVGPGYEYGGPVLCYDGYYARPVYDSYGGGRPYYVNRGDQYFSDENPSGCIIM